MTRLREIERTQQDTFIAEAIIRLRARALETGRLQRVAPATDAELADAVWEMLGLRIPAVAVCPGHSSPWQAFCDAYFARSPIAVWKASRGFGGKTVTLAALSMIEAITLGIDVNILGGSGAQSMRVHEEMRRIWHLPNAPRDLLAAAPTLWTTRFRHGNVILALLASQRSVRGSHPVRLHLDEVDEMPLDIFDAAMGQTMTQYGVAAQTVVSSTHQYADGTFTEVLKRAAEKGWIVHSWCYKETMEPHGWLLQSEVDRKRSEVTASMWCLPPTQGVVMADGRLLPVEILKEGDVILSGSGNQRRVTRVWHRWAEEKMVHLSVQGLRDPVMLTGNHEVLTSAGRKRAADLRRHDVLISPVIHLWDGGCYADGWIVGLYLAEGNVRKGRGHQVDFSIHRREVDTVVAALNQWHDAHPPTSVNGRPAGPAQVYTSNAVGREHVASVKLSNNTLTALLGAWVDTEATARIKSLRQFPMERNLAQGLLDGWLFGDGCRVANGWVGTTYSESLAWQMLQLATALGYCPGLSRGFNRGLSRNPYWHVNVSEFRPGWRDSVKVNEVLARLSAGQPKRRIARELGVGRNNITKWATIAAPLQYRNQLLRLEGVVGRRVSAIQTVDYVGPVYDLSVEEDHTFLAGGVAVSNSTEYDLQEPSPESRAIQPEKVAAMFQRSLGEWRGGNNEYIELEPPVAGAGYAHGADWARSVDYTIIITLRTDCLPYKLVAFERLQRLPWPVMIARLDARIERFPGAALHDGTGLGDVVDGYLTQPAQKFIFMGRARTDLLSEYIAAIERGELLAPYIAGMETEHRTASVESVYGSEHLPDTIAAGALAYRAARSGFYFA